MAKTKYAVCVVGSDGLPEIQTVLASKEDAEWYAKQYCHYKDQMICKFTVMKIMTYADRRDAQVSQ